MAELAEVVAAVVGRLQPGNLFATRAVAGTRKVGGSLMNAASFCLCPCRLAQIFYAFRLYRGP